MSNTASSLNRVDSEVKKRKKESMWKQTLIRFSHDRLAMLGFIGLLIMVLLSICAPLLTNYTPEEMDFFNINSGFSREHLLGTDALGRDYLTRLLYGGRYSLVLGIVSALGSSAIGIVVGGISGYYGGGIDNMIMRLCDIIQSIPGMMISIIISLVLGTGYWVTVVALAIGSASYSVRLARAQVLSIRQQEYLDAARLTNCSTPRILFRHILPNVLSPLLIDFTTNIAKMIQFAAGLSVIGLGVQPPTPEWGQMLSAGRNVMRTYPHLVMLPGICIFLISFFINLMGDGMRDALDPKLKT